MNGEEHNCARLSVHEFIENPGADCNNSNNDKHNRDTIFLGKMRNTPNFVTELFDAFNG